MENAFVGLIASGVASADRSEQEAVARASSLARAASATSIGATVAAHSVRSNRSWQALAFLYATSIGGGPWHSEEHEPVHRGGRPPHAVGSNLGMSPAMPEVKNRTTCPAMDREAGPRRSPPQPSNRVVRLEGRRAMDVA